MSNTHKSPEDAARDAAQEAVNAFFLVLMDSIDKDTENKYDFGGFASVQFDKEATDLEQMALGFRNVLLSYYNECKEEQKRREESK